MTRPMSVPASLELRLEALLAGAPGALADTAAIYREARAISPVLASGQVVFVTGYEPVRAGLRDPERLSNRALVTGSRIAASRAKLNGEQRSAFDEVVAFFSNFPSRNDGVDHARLRRIAHRAFTPRRIAELQTATRRYVDEQIAALADHEVSDGMTLADQVPLMIVCDLLSVPPSDRDMIHAWSVKLGAATASMEGEPMVHAAAALREFRAYVATMLVEHRARPEATDLIRMLIGAEQEERVTEEELAALFVQLLFAGHETTSTLISVGLLGLLRAPEQWRALVEDPSLIPNAIEELLRIVSPAQFVSRLTTEDMELGGTAISADTAVLLVLAGANRDPTVFADPDVIDVRRLAARHNLTFAVGPHFCLGAALARLEARIVLETLTVRHPKLELAGDDMTWHGGAMLRRLSHLPLRLGHTTTVAAA
jgi:cytochrome P450